MGVDLCSPMFVKNMYFDGFGRMYKTWVVLYTCAVSRGVVLDVVKDQGAGAIIKSFCRFVSRRGCLDEIVLDMDQILRQRKCRILWESLGLIGI